MQGTWVEALVREDPTCHGAGGRASVQGDVGLGGALLVVPGNLLGLGHAVLSAV